MKAFIFITFLAGCASAKSVPALENRTLYISPTDSGLYYQWKECTKKGLFGCREETMVTEFFDLRDPQVREQLRNMGFKAQSERRLKP